MEEGILYYIPGIILTGSGARGVSEECALLTSRERGKARKRSLKEYYRMHSPKYSAALLPRGGRLSGKDQTASGRAKTRGESMVAHL